MPRWAAYLVVFVASCCTLILEIVAGRILAPFIGVSLYTWTSIIGVVLAGISLGNYVGGRVADRWPVRRTLGVLLAAAALASVAVLPLINLAIAIPISHLVDAGNRLGGALAVNQAFSLVLRIVVITAIIFFLPCFVLGMVSPVVVKLSLRDMKSSGGLVGKIYALSTLGSIVGTFATGFVLVQTFGSRWIVLGVAVALLAMAVLLGDLLVARTAAVPLAAATMLVAALVPLRNATLYDCLFEAQCLGRAIADGATQAVQSGCLRETSYYCIRIQDEPASGPQPVKALVLDHLVHSYNSLSDPHYLQYGYIRIYAEFADLLAQRLARGDLHILYIGGGGYTLARHIEATYPNAMQEVLEIDPGVTQTVYEQLGVDPASTRITTYNVDARLMVDQLLPERTGVYDLIVGDAFNDLSIPYHLTTREFDQKLHRLLKPDGVYLALVIDKLQRGRFMPAYVETLLTVWPNASVLSDGTAWDNPNASTYVVAATGGPLTSTQLRLAAPMAPGGQHAANVMPPDRMLAWRTNAHAPVLTDDFAPVDNLIAPLFAERGF